MGHINLNYKNSTIFLFQDLSAENIILNEQFIFQRQAFPVSRQQLIFNQQLLLVNRVSGQLNGLLIPHDTKGHCRHSLAVDTISISNFILQLPFETGLSDTRKTDQLVLSAFSLSVLLPLLKHVACTDLDIIVPDSSSGFNVYLVQNQLGWGLNYWEWHALPFVYTLIGAATSTTVIATAPIRNHAFETQTKASIYI